MKIFGILLLLVGVILLVFGSWQYYQSITPDTCEVSFMSSLGGKSSYAFEEALRNKKISGVICTAVGFLAVLIGGACLLKSNKRHKAPSP